MSQPDFEPSQFKRRATDSATGGSCPCGQEMIAMLQKMETDIREIRHGMGSLRTAFIRNDLGDPDFEGHRQAHIGMVKKHETGERAKEAGTLKVIGIVIAAVAAIFVSGLNVHIQKMMGGWYASERQLAHSAAQSMVSTPDGACVPADDGRGDAAFFL